MPDEDDKNLAAARALDSMPPDAPTEVTELPAELLEALEARRTAEAARPGAAVPAAPRPKEEPVPKPPSSRGALPRPIPRPAMPPPRDSSGGRLPASVSSGRLPPLTPPSAVGSNPNSSGPVSNASASEESEDDDKDWASEVEDDNEADPPSADMVDVEAPTVAAALDPSSFADLPLPQHFAANLAKGGVLRPPVDFPNGAENLPSPLASTVSPAFQSPGVVRQTARMKPPGPAEAPWANPNAPRHVPPAPRPSLVDQPSALGWAIGGIVVAVVLVGLLVWLIYLVFHNFVRA